VDSNFIGQPQHMERRQKERKEKTKKRESEASRGVLAACEEKLYFCNFLAMSGYTFS
jgi:hypothetical protein